MRNVGLGLHGRPLRYQGHQQKTKRTKIQSYQNKRLPGSQIGKDHHYERKRSQNWQCLRDEVLGKNTIGLRIMKQNQEGHWIGINVKTNKEVIIKSADRLRGLYNPKAADKLRTSGHAAAVGSESAAAGTGANWRQAGRPDRGDKSTRASRRAVNCQEMVRQMLEKGYWKTDGKTPSSTIYSAIIREIAVKKEASRFRKVERGKFALAK